MPTRRPPTCLYSTRSGPRPARSHSAAQAWTSARRSPISAGPGPRSGTSSGAHVLPGQEGREQSGPLPAHGFAHVGGAGPRLGRGGPSHLRPPPPATGAPRVRASRSGLVLLDRQRPQPGVPGRRVVDEADRGHVGLDHVDLLQRRDDQQLQAEPLEQLEREPGRLIRAPAEGLVDDREPEGPRLGGAPLQLELVDEGGGEDRVRELLLLPAGLAAGVGVRLVLAVVLAVALGGGEGVPVPHVGDQPRPLLVRVGQPLAALEPLDDPLHLQELLLGVLVVGRWPADTALSVQARRSARKSLISTFGVGCGSSLMYRPGL